MNNYILVGKIINTFGIKGELKLNSNFEYGDRVFKSNNKLYITENKIEEIIESVRIHKGYYLITFKNYNNINEVLKYKGSNIYINRDDLNLNEDEYLYSDLIGYEVYDNNDLLGVVKSYQMNNKYVYLEVFGDNKFLLPLIDNYIIKIDKDNKKILTNKGSELII